MSADTYNDVNTEIRESLNPDAGMTRERAEKIHKALTRAFGLPEVTIGPGGERGVPTTALKRKFANDPEWVEERYGTRHPFVAMATAGQDYTEERESGTVGESQTTRAIDSVMDARETTPDGERALVDNGVIGAAAPVDVDPMIWEVERSAAPELSIVQSVAQPGFSFKYNVIKDRDSPIGMLSEAEAAGDLEDQFTPQSFTLSDETKDMKRQVGLFKVSDFSQRAMETLQYMDPRETTLGQGVISHQLFKAKQLFYGDPSVGAGDNSIEDTEAFEGLAKIAADASNVKDKSTVSSGILEDLLDELTTATLNSGLTWDRARFMVSQQLYNKIYEEATPTIRLDGYDADVEFGPQGISLSTEYGTAPITPAPNIRNYSGLTGVGSTSGTGDVFLIDELAVQFRQLAPMSTIPLGRTGLADRVAMFEYYTLVDRSQGEHTYRFEGYDI